MGGKMTASQPVRPIPTMRDIAAHLGVSRQLVSLVLRNAPGPSAESRARILAAADELGYRPNTSARLLRQRRTHLIGVLFALRNPFEVRFVERLEARAAEEGFGLVLGARSEDRTDDVVVSQLLAQRVEAMIAFNPDAAAPSLQDAIARIPVIWMGERARSALVDSVRVDEDGGLRAAIDHLVAFGHRNIAYIGGGGGIVGTDRAQAYLKAMTAAGLRECAEVLQAGFNEDSGADVAREFAARPIATRPTALICCGDLNAVGVLAAFARINVRVPEDVSVVGFDDSYVAALSYHQLTSIRQDVEATVDAALSTVLQRLTRADGQRHETLTKTTLVVRASTGPNSR